MKRINIAVGVDEKGKIWKGHFGIAPYFLIYDADKNFIEKRLNPYGTAAAGKHNHHDNPKLIIGFLDDCNVFVAKRMGQESQIKLEKNFGIKPVIVSTDNVDEALKNV
jgi:predicted Fe-Mo cluster-binding NifX family protein